MTTAHTAATRQRLVSNSPFHRLSLEKWQSDTFFLQSRGVLTKVRNSAGQDVDGGCGQLRARAVGTAQVVELRRMRIAKLEAT